MLKIPSIKAIRQKRIESLKKKITDKNNQKRKQFYSNYQTFNRIRDYEITSACISEFLETKPDNMSESAYLHKLIKMNSGNVDLKDLKMVNNTVAQSNSSSYSSAMQIYYTQQEFLNPTLESLRSNIDFDRIQIDKKPIKENDENRFSRLSILKILNDSKNLTLDSGSLLKRKYIKSTIYDLPLRFATACYNSRDIGNGYIDDKVPEMFKDIPEDEIFEAMDLFSTRYRDYFHGKNFNVQMEIGGKDFCFEYIKSGREAIVFRIRDDKNNSAIIKIFKTKTNISENDIAFAPYGIYGNIGLLREANMAGVVDVPELYLANPIYIPINSSEDKYLGGWAIIEDVNDKKIKKEGLRLEDWLCKLGLQMLYDDKNNKVNSVMVDLDCIANARNHDNCLNAKLVNQVYSRYLNFETTEDIINYLKQQ